MLHLPLESMASTEVCWQLPGERLLQMLLKQGISELGLKPGYCGWGHTTRAIQTIQLLVVLMK